MLTPLIKTASMDGPDGLWGVFNNTRELTCSKDGYLLSITREDIGRFDDMTPEQERQFWDFTFTAATEGLHDPSKRGLAPSAEQPENCGVVCLVNDGTAAWQNVGTSHAHIVWTSTPETIGDLQKRLQEDRAFYAGGETYLPLATTTITLNAATVADDIRAARQTLRDQFQKEAGDICFSLYTKTPQQEDPRKGADFVIEAWSKEHHSVSSLSQSVRYWNGLWGSPINPQAMGLKYSGFHKQMP